MKLIQHKLIRQVTLAGIGVVFLGILAGKPAYAQNYGIHFLGNTTDSVTGSAGVVPISGWNNIGNSFASGAISSSDGLQGATLTMSGAWPGDGGWHSGGTISDGGNGSLLNGYLDTGANIGTGSVSATITGLAAGQLFNLYIYIYSDASHPANGGDYLQNYAVNGTTYYVPQLGNGTTTFNSTSTSVGGAFGGFVQGTTFGANFNTATANASDFGNYIKISGISAVGGIITITPEADTQSWRSPLNGFQIVAVPEPTTLVLSVAGLAVFGMIRRRNN